MNEPSGVQPHAGISWREKYEYINTLWLKQKDLILTLNTEKQNIYTEIQGQLQIEVAKKNTEIVKLQEELAKKNTEINSLRTTNVKSKDSSLTNLEENPKAEKVKNSNTDTFLSKECSTYFTLLLLALVSILLMNILSQKSSLLLLTIGEKSLLLPPP